ncbi:hypothetical protein CFP56_020199 [Quercus suber]|uniref:Uncharacterized protein n=1 Tax=Quercus suber TaxID=58331 RepID=A0AAW0KI09_QUESU
MWWVDAQRRASRRIVGGWLLLYVRGGWINTRSKDGMGDNSGNDRGVGGRMSEPGHGCGVGGGMVGLGEGCGVGMVELRDGCGVDGKGPGVGTTRGVAIGGRPAGAMLVLRLSVVLGL